MSDVKVRPQRVQVLQNFLKLVQAHPEIQLYTARENNPPMPYLRAYELDFQDTWTKTTEGSEIRLVFACYSGHRGFLETIDIREALNECLAKLYKTDSRVIMAHMAFSPTRDVQRPDVKQGFFTVHIKCMY